MKKFFAVLSVAFLFAACASSTAGKKTTVSSADLKHRNFVLQEYNGKIIYVNNPDRQPTITFNQNMRINGIICNNLNGPAKLEGNVLTATTATTRMTCPETNLMQAEGSFLRALEEGAIVEVYGDALTIRHKGNKFLFKQAGN